MVQVRETLHIETCGARGDFVRGAEVVEWELELDEMLGAWIGEDGAVLGGYG